ncbi:MAG: M24 family metallopeptidase [Candidatus Sumerlaeota bacterium]|nr:M24 family metallopeptidase [Candidatus Sumerlaeota bacterium]
MNRRDECRHKLAQVREILGRRQLKGIVLGAQNNVSWLSAGGEFHIALSTTAAAGQILVTPKDAVCFTENIEAARLAAEELAGTDVRVEAGNWWEGKTLEQKVAALVDPKQVGADGLGGSFADVSAEVADLRLSLLDAEVERFRVVAARAEHAMWETCRLVEPGMTESEVAGLLAEQVYAQGCQPVVNLIAADERIRLYRHPVPKATRVNERVMIVLCARMKGLIASLTRIVSFAEPDADSIRRHEACVKIDATLIANSRVDAEYAAIFDKACKAYADTGYAAEWHLHHQGGPAGYNTREIRVNPSVKAKARRNQPVAWNPSITGTKSEDTIVILDGGPEVVTCSLPWPMLEVEAEGETWRRPDWLMM